MKLFAMRKNLEQMSLVLICLSFLLPYVQAVTAPNSTLDDGNVQNNRNLTLNWQLEPIRRGTRTLLSSCIVTLALCMWSVVHLDVPPKRNAWIWLYFQRLFWVFSGLFCPEVILFFAIQQNVRAGKLCPEVITAFQSHSDSEPCHTGTRAPRKACWSLSNIFRQSAGKRHSIKLDRNSQSDLATHVQWTKTHGYYTQMGGFALDTTLADEPFFPSNQTRFILTTEGLRFLAKHAPEMLPSLPSKYHIRDKSKANGFSRALISLQLLWYSVQCMERYAQGLYVSFLEITTLAHCACAILIYFLWWEKPFGVEEPTVRFIRGEKMDSICAYMWMSSHISGQWLIGLSLTEFGYIKFAPNMVDPDAGPADTSNCSTCHEAEIWTNLLNRDFSDLPGVDLDAAPAETWPVSCGKRGSCTPACVTCENCTTLNHGGSCKSNPARYIDLKMEKSSFSTPDTAKVILRRGQYLSRAGLEFHPQWSHFAYYDPFYIEWVAKEPVLYIHSDDIARWKLASLAITKYGLPEFSRVDMNYMISEPSTLSDGISNTGNWVVPLVTGIGGSLYGAIHFLGWNNAEPNENPFMWRFCTITVSVPVILSIICIVFGYRRLLRLVDPRPKNILIANLLVLVYFLLGGLWIVAKLSLIAIAVIDALDLPNKAYDVPVWSTYIPHVT